MRTQIFSYGGGVQSVAICVLILQGRLPKPDFVVISDTGYERSSTWRYLDAYTGPALARLGIGISRIDRRAWESQDFIQEYAGKRIVALPTHFQVDGGGGRSRGFCSDKWKRYVIRRWLKSQGVTSCDVWLGFTSDELRRVRVSDVAWAQNAYPLLGGLFGGPGDLILSRQDCLALIHSYGWPLPQKSSCYICPNMRNAEWASLPTEEFIEAVRIEQEIQAVQDGYMKYLHPSCRPLSDVDFSQNDFSSDMFGCDSGFCFV